MGLFKGMRDLKALGDHHGGMPSIKDALSDLGKVADDRGEGEVLRDGVPAKAIVRGFAMPVADDRFAMEIDLEVQPRNGAPYPVTYRFPTARMKAPLTPGLDVPVKVHPSDPQRIAVQWDIHQGAIAAAGGDMAAVQQGLNQTYGGAADAAMRQAMENMKTGGQDPPATFAPGGGTPAPAAGDDSMERLRKLGELRASGVLTDSEFEAQKAKILADM